MSESQEKSDHLLYSHLGQLATASKEPVCIKVPHHALVAGLQEELRQVKQAFEAYKATAKGDLAKLERSASRDLDMAFKSTEVARNVAFLVGMIIGAIGTVIAIGAGVLIAGGAG